ncbi:hypothetical protein EJ110_NYTH58210 [Nymphaea thermarum]|nr:hypothetical protein EJ110_NYTH58210 [Nymphaea thermarum]
MEEDQAIDKGMLIKSDVVDVVVVEEGQAIDKGVLICLLSPPETSLLLFGCVHIAARLAMVIHVFYNFTMADSSRSEGSNEYKMAGNSSYGTTIKLDGSNYEIWSRVFMMSVASHRKKYILEEDEPLEKKENYATWDEDNNIVMSWIMNSVESCIAPTIACYTKVRDMWSFLKKTYSHATNVSKILQLEEELFNIRQGDQDLSQYLTTLTAAYERLKALRPPCKHCYASYFETGMVAKFLSGLSSDYSMEDGAIVLLLAREDVAQAVVQDVADFSALIVAS